MEQYRNNLAEAIREGAESLAMLLSETDTNDTISVFTRNGNFVFYNTESGTQVEILKSE